jgi:hypothetical protein
MACPSIGTSGLITYLDFVRANGCFLVRTTEEGLEITDALTLGGWFWFDTQSTGNLTGLMGKWMEAGNQRAYVLRKLDSDKLSFDISIDGSVETTINDGGANYAISHWFFIVGRFTPSTELALFVNGTWYSEDTSIPASIHNSTNDFYVGRYNGTNYLDGRMCHMFLSAYAIPDVFIEANYAHTKALFGVK